MHPLRPDKDAEAGVFVREFDARALAELREAVLDYASACSMPGDRATDVLLAVHELAANAVRHGPGHGRVKLHVAAGNLHCEVSDPGTFSHARGASPQTPGPSGPMQWPVEQGHGLWLVHATADHVRVTSGPHGSLITVVFTLSTEAAPPPEARRPGGPGDGTGH
jgi:anti-sigma regulatory factor (Ser/Thr protein kinase)